MELNDNLDIFLFEDEYEIEKEIDMQLNIIELFDKLHKEEINKEQMSVEELTRFNKLCDDQGFDYDEIKKFEYWLTTPTCEQWRHYFEIKHKYDKMIKTPEFEKLFLDRIEKNNEYIQAGKELLRIKEEDYVKKEARNMALDMATDALEKGDTQDVDTILNYIDENYMEDYIPITGIANFKGGTSEEISDLITKLKWNIKHSIRIALITIIIAILLICTNDEFAIFISIIAISTGLYNLFKSLSLKVNKRILKKAFDEHQSVSLAKKTERDNIINNEKRLLNELNEIKEQMTKLKKIQEDKFSENSEEFASLKKEMNCYEQRLLSGKTTFNMIEFDDFRKNHFNDNAERLLRKLGIKGISKILRDDAVQQGSEEDYRRFIEDKILSMDDLYFENYREYYKNTSLKNNPQ